MSGRSWIAQSAHRSGGGPHKTPRVSDLRAEAEALDDRIDDLQASEPRESSDWEHQQALLTGHALGLAYAYADAREVYAALGMENAERGLRFLVADRLRAARRANKRAR